VLIASHDGQAIGALHARASETGVPRHTFAVVVDPAVRATGVARQLVEHALGLVAERGGGPVELWAFGADDQADAFARATGFTPARELWQMRVPLPLDEPPAWPEGVRVRTFEPGRDEDAWLAVNNRAFRDDPDQGGWTRETLALREGEPWFDPAGFLLAEVGDELGGFCWTKVHPAEPPREPGALGEIYVIGVDPKHQGTGLGRALVVGGLDSLHQRDVSTGMLFVDAANKPAVSLYRALGFDVARVDRAYTRTAP
jgi:mycothiol synthase